MAETIGGRLKHAWNAFRSRDSTDYQDQRDLGYSSSRRQDRVRLHITSERSVIISVYNRIALDVSAVSIQHVKVDQNGRYAEGVNSGINYCFTTEANIDQTSTDFFHDLTYSLFDEGVVAVVITEATNDPSVTGMYNIGSVRVGKITQWYPTTVRVKLYNENPTTTDPVTKTINFYIKAMGIRYQL